MYLGHKVNEEIATLASKLTLHANKEINFNFFSTVRSGYKNDYSDIEYGLQGFCISRHSVKELPLAIIEEAIKDMECIFINKHHLPHEILLTIAADNQVMNHWYKTMWEGAIANKICRKFNYFEGEYDKEAVPAYRAKIREEMNEQLIVI
jgi:hypothetical protein|tara:strand:+ start:706 stop:1155 length:450 start_codon:yes stop_codon:yes gene_type:complete